MCKFGFDQENPGVAVDPLIERRNGLVPTITAPADGNLEDGLHSVFFGQRLIRTARMTLNTLSALLAR